MTLRAIPVGALRRGAAAALLALTTLASPASAAPVQWQAWVGDQTGNQAIQANAFLARELWIDVGDQVQWTHQSGEIHTVTFLAGTPRPDFIVPNGSGGVMLNPVAVNPAGGPTFDGSAYTNSGLMAAPGQAFALTFTKPGDFQYSCLVHRQMKGVVHVAAAGTPYPHSQGFYNQQAKAEAAQLFAEGKQLADHARAAAGATGVIAGTGEVVSQVGGVMDARFYPDRQVIRAGETVRFTNLDPETPHTVTFGPPPSGGPIGAFAPVGEDSPGHATITSNDTTVNSGFLGRHLPYGWDFRATFPTPGTYAYICALHRDLGMYGEIIVLPAGG